MDQGLNSEQIKENVKSRAFWQRFILMLVLVFCLWLASLVAGFVILFQTLYTLITAESNRNMLDFGALLTEYIECVLAFLMFNSEDAPFPFSPLPGAKEAGGGPD